MIGHKTYIRIIKHYTEIDQLLILDLIFPVCKIDHEYSEKRIVKERLKIPKRYSETVVFEIFQQD